MSPITICQAVPSFGLCNSATCLFVEAALVSNPGSREVIRFFIFGVAILCSMPCHALREIGRRKKRPSIDTQRPQRSTAEGFFVILCPYSDLLKVDHKALPQGAFAVWLSAVNCGHEKMKIMCKARFFLLKISFLL